MAAEHVDILQIPAFLCRQTDLLVAAARTGKMVNIKKASSWRRIDALRRRESTRRRGGTQVAVTERGTTFGYGDLVVDFRGIPQMKQKLRRTCNHGHNTLVAATQPDIRVTGGQPALIETMARAAIATGADGIFLETHRNPAEAKSDGANMLPLDRLEKLLEHLCALRDTVNTFK